jgi:15-cis-phytoene synthase
VSAPAQPSAADVVRIAARAHERDRYLAALLSPRAVRDDLVALAAFAGEVGRIPLYVREPMMGRIRLQWWRERIETATAGGHPVAAAMIATIGRHHMATDKLQALIDAHEDSLDDRPFADEAALLAYVDRIDGGLFGIAAMIGGDNPAPEFIAAAGRAYGLARIGLEAPAARSHGRVLLPGSATSAGAEPPDMGLNLRRTATMARHYLAASAAGLSGLPRRSRGPYLPLALVEPYLQALEKKQMLPGVVLDIAPLTRVWRLMRCRWTGMA